MAEDQDHDRKDPAPSEYERGFEEGFNGKPFKPTSVQYAKGFWKGRDMTSLQFWRSESSPRRG